VQLGRLDHERGHALVRGLSGALEALFGGRIDPQLEAVTLRCSHVLTMAVLTRGVKDCGRSRSVADMKETRAVSQWADGERRIQDPGGERRLRVAFQAAWMLTRRDSVQVVQTWFQGLNSHLED